MDQACAAGHCTTYFNSLITGSSFGISLSGSAGNVTSGQNLLFGNTTNCMGLGVDGPGYVKADVDARAIDPRMTDRGSTVAARVFLDEQGAPAELRNHRPLPGGSLASEVSTLAPGRWVCSTKE